MNPKRWKPYFFGTMLIAFGGLAAVLLTQTAPNLGLDLRGGISVTLRAVSDQAITTEVLQETADIIAKRVNATGVGEADVSTAGSDNIIIQLPGVKNEAKALKLIGTTGQLTFRQVEQTYG